MFFSVVFGSSFPQTSNFFLAFSFCKYFLWLLEIEAGLFISTCPILNALFDLETLMDYSYHLIVVMVIVNRDCLGYTRASWRKHHSEYILKFRVLWYYLQVIIGNFSYLFQGRSEVFVHFCDWFFFFPSIFCVILLMHVVYSEGERLVYLVKLC